jgi:hypothetical protein|tara:strand:+ start:139 stop:468 length:330 start_codon:yes stop_codon:yes gene_type:complete
MMIVNFHEDSYQNTRGSQLVNAIIIGLGLIVLFCLFRALYFMVTLKGPKQGEGVANFLMLRVTFSAILIGFIVVANYAGWIELHGPYQDPRLAPSIEQNQEEKSLKEDV